MNHELPENERFQNSLKTLEDVQKKLARVNEQLGYMAKCKAMKHEIEELGWEGICARYHPDINVDDPAAYELFQYYRFVYDNMSRI